MLTDKDVVQLLRSRLEYRDRTIYLKRNQFKNKDDETIKPLKNNKLLVQNFNKTKFCYYTKD
jgi:hypothetical protein